MTPILIDFGINRSHLYTEHVLVPLTINKSHSRQVELLLVVLRALPAQCEIWVLNKDDPLFSFLSIEMTPIFVFLGIWMGQGL